MKTYRTFAPLDLVLKFAEITCSAPVRGRDAKLIRVHMEETAEDAIGMLYFMYLYSLLNLPRDIPSFLRWKRRMDISQVAPPDRLLVETTVAMYVSGAKQLPRFALIYMDLSDEELFHSAAMETLKNVKEEMRKYSETILDAPFHSGRKQ